MKIGSFDTAEKVMIIAEVGNNHEGSYARAEEMIGRAVEAGADMVKFQSFVPERWVTADQTARLEMLRRFQFSRAQFEALAETTRKAGVQFLCTPFDLETAAWLAPLVPAVKIASADNDWTALLRQVAATGKPIILSTGMAGLADVTRARDLIRGEWRKLGMEGGGLVLLHCVVSYPTPAETANLLAINTLAGLGETIGYSDHTMGVDAAVAAVAMGARVVEKHFTLDKNQSDFRDHKLSADPQELAELVRRIRLVESMRGSGEKAVLAVEEPAFNAVRRGVYAARDLPKGAVLSESDVVYLRPRVGLSPADIDRRMGQALTLPVAAGAPLTEESFT
jgi:N-acetylneuraminate synthase/N,N'-diacetyllegionaminate synthase